MKIERQWSDYWQGCSRKRETPAGRHKAHGQDFGGENILLRAQINHSEMATQALLFWLSRLTLPTQGIPLKNGKI